MTAFTIDYRPLIAQWQHGALLRWGLQLDQQIAAGLNVQRYGDLPRWLQALQDLPPLHADSIHLDASRVGASSRATPDAGTIEQLKDALRRLHPWRKGPFELFGVHIDTEWRSDWKWERVQHAIDPLTGRTVLDVGCGSGYHCWRMLGAGAAQVIGIAGWNRPSGSSDTPSA